MAISFALPACDSPSQATVGVAAHVEIISGDDQSGIVGQELAQPIVARVTDDDGRPLQAQAVQFRITGGGGQMVGTSAQTNEEGLATTRWILGTAANVVQVIEVRAVGENVEVGIRAAAEATGQPDIPAAIAPTVTVARTGPAGAALPEPVEIRVTDRYGNLRAGVTVNWVVKGGGGTAVPASSVTDAAGTARTTWTLGPMLGTNHLLEAVTEPGLVAEIAAAVQLPQGATVSKSGGDGQSAAVSTQLGAPLELRLVGPGGVPIAGAAVDWSASTATGQVVPLSSGTDADGRAAARVTFGRNVGSHQVFARIGDLPLVTFGVSATACPVAVLNMVQGSGQSGAIGTTLGSPLVVRIADASGNPIIGAGVTWSGSGSVSPSNAVSNSLGQISVNWTLGSTSGTQSITAGLGCSSGTFSATVRKRVATVTVSPSAPAIQVGATTQLSTTLRDEDGVVLTGVPVAWTSLDNSIASVSSSGLVSGLSAGSATIRATAEGISRQVVVAVSAPVGQVASISITPSAPRVKVGASTQLTALPLDDDGDVVTGATIAWTSLTPAIASVNQSGLVQGSTVGDATIRATSGGITRDVVVRATPNTPAGVPVMIDIVGGNQQTGEAGEELVLQLVARVTDSNGNPVANVFVAWVGDGSPFADVTSTTAQGITRNYWTLGSAPGPQRIELFIYDFSTGTRGTLLGAFTATATP